MRNTGTRGYSGYRGRRPSGKKWLIVALVLIIFAAAAFLAMQQWMVYEMDGTYHFELPWVRQSGGRKTVLRRPGQKLEIVIEQPEAPPEEPLHAQELDVTALVGDMSRALSALPEAVNAVAIRLKSSDGDLLYPSTLPAAVESHAVTGSSMVHSAIAEATASERYTIARISALHDSRFSYAHMTDAAILQKAYKNNIWYAPDSSHYLAPEKELTREYLVAIAAEIAAMDFDELLFDDFSYPVNGRLDNIDESARDMTKQEALELLALNLREAVSEYGTRLSVVMDEATVLAGGNDVSGQNLATLASQFDRVYVPTVPQQIPALQAALEPYAAELVPILAEPPAEGVYLISQ